MKLGEIVNDSIIENKQKTKCYWEQLMTANSESDSNNKKKSISPGTSRDCNVLKRFPPADNTTPKIKSSLIEREIQLQKERELDFAREQQQSRSKFQKSPKDILDNATHQTTTDSSELLGLSLTNTDDGNHSEYGSEDKEDHSLEDGLSIYHHQRTRSLDSMSSGHSSASGSGYGSLGESCVRRRQVTVKPLDEPDQINTLQFLRNGKETPIEREIRLSKEREDELRRIKGDPTTEVKPKEPLVQEKRNKIVLMAERSNSCDQSDTSLVERRVPVVFRKESINVASSSRQSPNMKGAIPKIFAPNPNQKGLMKRFIASRGRLSATFVPVQSPQPSQPPEKKDLSLLGVRPGYVSAEDKIQVELKEMRKREEELRKQQMARSQPNLLACFENESKTVEESKERESEVPQIGVLRSAQSIPNLLHSEQSNEPTERSKQTIKRSSMIDVWESMIQKN